jgi:glycosyltransferase EpsF
MNRVDKMKQDKYHILHVFGNMNCGGAENRIMDLYRYIDRSEIQFDFLVLFQGEHYFDEEIKQLGGKIFSVRHPRESILGHIFDVYKVMKNEGPFQAVHSHTSYHSGLILLIAKFAGIKNRIAHARTTSTKDVCSIKKRTLLSLGRLLIFLSSAKLVAISKTAAEFLFGKKSIKNKKVIIVPNSINLDSYKMVRDEEISQIKKQFNISNDKLVIGHVGRFSFMKNHKFIIDVANSLKEMKIDFVVILVGAGELKNEIENKVKESSLEENIIFLGIRDDVPTLMNVFDVLIMPSLFEGLGGVVIEAQAAGTPSIIADTLPPEVDLGINLVKFLPLDKSVDLWSRSLKESKLQQEINYEEIIKAFERNRFTLEYAEKEFRAIYSID